MNKIIICLIISDILILSAFGLIAPIFAIFMKEGISGGSVVAAGLASTIFLLTKSIVQLPFSIYLDKRKKKLAFLLLGTFLVVLVPIVYAFSPSINFIFLGQAIYGLGAAMAYPSWFSLFTMHLDRKHRGFEWAVWSTSIGFGTAMAAYFGAKLEETIGFKNLFFVVSAVSFLGLIALFFISKKYLKDVEKIEDFLIPRFQSSSRTLTTVKNHGFLKFHKR